MKKVTFILFALITGTTFAQDSDAATGTAQVNAEIVSPIEITSEGPLNFGRIIGNTEGGTVTIGTDGKRTLSNEDMDVPTTTNAPTAATFKVTAATDYSYSITIPNAVLTGNGLDMPVTFTHTLETEGNLGTGAPQPLSVGGVLTVNEKQAEGDYEGTVSVTVAYE